MRATLPIFAALLALSSAAWAGDCAKPKQECAQILSRGERKAAEKAFARGARAQREGRAVDALQEYRKASGLNPYNPDFAQAEEMALQQAVFEMVERGNQLQGEMRPLEALAAFRQALELDPKSEVAQARVLDVLPAARPELLDTAAQSRLHALRLVAQSDEIQLEPNPGERELSFRGDSRAMFENVGNQFGISVVFDDSFASRRVRMQVDAADFATALQLATRLSKSFAVPLSEKQILVAADNRQNRQQLERMSLRTFAVENATTPQELNDYTNLLRTIFEVRFVTPNAARSLIYVRGPKSLLDAATQILHGLSGARAQVMLELKVYEVNHGLLRRLGVNLPLQFRLFNVATEARSLLDSPGTQELINQLFASGGLNQVDATAIAALAAALANNNADNPLLAENIASFGGGKTETGVVIPSAELKVERNETWFRGITNVMLRAAHGDTATFRSGSRYPILNASFAPIANNPQISNALRNQTYQTPFPSFSYEDLGLTFKAKPVLSSSGDVTLELEIQMKSLAGTSFNSIPIISNREYKSSITVHDGDTVVIAGMITGSEQKSRRGLPGSGKFPGLNHLTQSSEKEAAQNQLLVLITPRMLRAVERPTGNTTVTLAN